MSTAEIIKELNSLPLDYQKEVENFIAFLKSKANKVEDSPKPKRQLGFGEGYMSPDFDEPLDDMKEYM